MIPTSGSYEKPQIKSLSLVSTHSSDSSMVTNKLSVDLSVPNLNNIKLINSARVRIAVANDGHCAAALDFITQRTNEYKEATEQKIEPYEYIKLIRESLDKDSVYYRPSAPFSPFSVNMLAMQNLQLDKFSRTGSPDGKSNISPSTTIYDVPLIDQLFRDSHGNIVFSTESQKPTATFKSINLTLPSGSHKPTQLSCYVFVYTPMKIKSSLYNSIDAMSLVTDVSPICEMVPIGKKTLYLKATETNPFPGKEITEELQNPDIDKNFTTKDGAVDSPFQDRLVLAKQKLVEAQRKEQQEKNHPTNKVIKDQNFFSDLWLSKDHQEKHRFLFSFDLRSFLVERSFYPFLYQNDSTAALLLSENQTDSQQNYRSKVDDLQVIRQVSENKSFGVLGDSITSLNNVPKKVQSQFPHIVIKSVSEQQIDLRGNQGSPGLIFYEGVDSFEKNMRIDQQISGRFLYGANISVYDAASDYLRQMLEFTMQAKDNIRKIQSYVTSGDTKKINSIYNPQTGKLRKSIRSLDVHLGSGVVNIYDLIKTDLMKIESLVEALTEMEKVDLVGIFEKQAELDDGRISYDMFVLLLDLYNEVYFMVENLVKIQFPNNPVGSFFDIKKDQIQHNSALTKLFPVIKHSHTFWDSYSRGDNFGFGADYLFEENPTSENGLNSMSFLAYIQRQQDEFNKYFKDSNGSAAVIPAGSYLGPSYCYFTAKTVMTPGKEKIVQTEYVDAKAASVSYPMNRYGELFADIVDYRIKQDNRNSPYVYLQTKPTDSSIGNFIGSNVMDLLKENFSVTFPREVAISFKVPVPTLGSGPVTVINSGDQQNCATPSDSNLIPSVIGGSNSQDPSVVESLKNSEDNIKNLSLDRKKGYTDILNKKNKNISSPTRLPFLMMGELSIGGSLDNNQNYNSLTALKNFLNIPANKVESFLQTSYISRLPNQIKSMLAFAASDDVLALGGEGGSLLFEPCRPRLKSDEVSAKGDSTISYYGDLVDIPPYPTMSDPMKNYAQFLAFWLNYKQISVVEYLHGFLPTNSSNEQKTKLPSWRRVDTETIDYMSTSGQSKLLCRVRETTPRDYLEMVGDALTDAQKTTFASFFEPKGVLSLPIYNKYFYLDGLASPISGSVQNIQETESTNTTLTAGILSDGVSINELQY